MIIKKPLVFPGVSKLFFMVSKNVKVTLCVCTFFCPHSVFELLPPTSLKKSSQHKNTDLQKVLLGANSSQEKKSRTAEMKPSSI